MRAQPFSAPETSPARKKRCSAPQTTAQGIIAITAPESSSP
ncbi:MAG TPA: hypothetical protein VGI05_23255 [Streptosporangiaceae bacterium]